MELITIIGMGWLVIAAVLVVCYVSISIDEKGCASDGDRPVEKYAYVGLGLAYLFLTIIVLAFVYFMIYYPILWLIKEFI